MASQPRPSSGPLRELPLEWFTPDPTSSSHASLTKGRSIPLSSLKRQREEPQLFSPAKRRILHQEGIFVPSKTVKSPFGVLDTVSRSRVDAVHFGTLLSGTDSPARRLDFGLPEPEPQKHPVSLHAVIDISSDTPAAPKSQPLGFLRPLTSSPELKSESRRSIPVSTPLHSPSSDPPSTPPTPRPAHITPKPTLPVIGEWGFDHVGLSDERSWGASSIRPLPGLSCSTAARPAPAWLQHHPGFTIYRDLQLAAHEPDDDDWDLTPREDEFPAAGLDLDKENLPARRRSKKSISVSVQKDLRHESEILHMDEDAAELPGTSNGSVLSWPFLPPVTSSTLGSDGLADPDSNIFSMFLPQVMVSGKSHEVAQKERRRLLECEMDDEAR
jgi:hypothetical protein